jgi:hypothetical protein
MAPVRIPRDAGGVSRHSRNRRFRSVPSRRYHFLQRRVPRAPGTRRGRVAASPSRFAVAGRRSATLSAAAKTWGETPSELALPRCSKTGDFRHDETALLSRTISFTTLARMPDDGLAALARVSRRPRGRVRVHVSVDTRRSARNRAWADDDRSNASLG